MDKKSSFYDVFRFEHHLFCIIVPSIRENEQKLRSYLVMKRKTEELQKLAKVTFNGIILKRNNSRMT